ncbi:UTP--glucose-1-phosphate uridylyltransferase GalU [Paraburkholderia lycopersici]|uniref:UTP--glucose-1-phosphate uridylyltransferase n=1 Tax=Paraburkholderia lycopersici TaxID=416944 RepID=A0A1G6JD04_9BURK|nr:UTP--glucose-1-phosphate uridylyltransferase GalU [Paraburkholderia lycopersici]SDC16752.1 UTP--glucose-1-phosphate uridylyltransferase [Paraburkholderia lycopersici]
MLGVRKAVFPVAGIDTSFLPATKASPKEMLPVIDKPLIQYAVEEAIGAGITELIFVTGRGKRVIEDHFDKSYEVEQVLKARGKQDLVGLVQSIKPSHVECIYVRQAEPLGLGHAVLCAEKLIGDEPFAVVLADDLLDGTPPILAQMVHIFSHYDSSVLAVEEFESCESTSHGVIDGRHWDERVISVSRIVEKPSPELAPSRFGVAGRYVLMPSIFGHLRSLKPDLNGEIQLTSAIHLMRMEEQVLAYEFVGKRYDCGTKLGYVQATVDFALRHAELHETFDAWLRERLGGAQPAVWTTGEALNQPATPVTGLAH